MKYPIVTYGDPILRQAASPVGEIDDSTRQLVRDMLETMYSADGVGLAAEQVGKALALTVIDVPAKLDTDEDGQRENPDVEMPMVLIDPRIVAEEGRDVAEEGCLSFPDITARVKRAWRVTVAYRDLNGENQRADVQGLLARAVQHELDHLNGVLLSDRMSPVARAALSGKLKRLAKREKKVR